MDQHEISSQFIEMEKKYDKLGGNIKQALESFLNEKKISFLSINYRIKDISSFIEKVERKKYENPFDELEDICGVRIICYYKSDVDKICDIIGDEFEVLENQDKEELLGPDQFGYRSTHFIVKINNQWLQAPQFRGLENLKTEIQVRTVLMHAWAEIEHKLAYKKNIHIPNAVKRRLFILSAYLEGTDVQFEELRHLIQNYKQDVVNLLKDETASSKEIELNLDSLQSFLDLNFPDRGKNIEKTSDLVDEFLKFKIKLHDLQTSYEEVKDFLPEFEREDFKNPLNHWVQVGVARIIMALANEHYRENRHIPESVKERYRKWAERIKKYKSAKTPMVEKKNKS